MALLRLKNHNSLYMSLPKKFDAIVVRSGHAVLKSDLPLVEPLEGQLLIKVRAVAGNPTDWKHLTFGIGPEGAVMGNDLAGEVVKLGPNVDPKTFPIGTTVCGMIHGSSRTFPRNGAFSQYCVLDSKLAFKIPLTSSNANFLPEGIIDTFPAAASVPLALITAAEVLYYHCHNKMAWKGTREQNLFPLLVWGGGGN